ncbi:M42 family metallopeptidase [Salmonella enterica subsp. enterica serovar Typhimurium]|nr:M42 family metallopeptidase [Salmonella enterica subsp. enterica serovar Typhimurium]
MGVAEALASTPLDIAVFLVASVQEEFNIRGIIPVLRRVRPTWRLVLISPPPATRLTCRITQMCGSTTASASPV